MLPIREALKTPKKDPIALCLKHTSFFLKKKITISLERVKTNLTAKRIKRKEKSRKYSLLKKGILPLTLSAKEE